MAEKTTAEKKVSPPARPEWQLWIYWGDQWRMVGFFETADEARIEAETKWAGFKRQAKLVQVDAAEVQ